EGRERRDESVRSGGVLDAEGGRQPDEQADDEPEEDQHPQEPAAADVLANLVGGDRDDLGQGARRHRRSDSWMRSRQSCSSEEPRGRYVMTFSPRATIASGTRACPSWPPAIRMSDGGSRQRS